jgi:hypothetical protein
MLPIGERADLVEFGRVKGWQSGGEQAFARRAGPPWRAIADGKAFNLGVEWDEPREFSEVRFVLEKPLSGESVHAEYWVSSWPPPRGRGGWTEVDTPWKGEWRQIRGSLRQEQGATLISFDPLSPDENAKARNRPEYTPRFRRALKLRLRFEAGEAPLVTKLQVMGASRWNVRDVRVETGCEGKPKSAFTAGIYNGRIVQQNPDSLRLLYLEHPPDSNDRSMLTLAAGEFKFGIALDDLIRHKGIYVRDAATFIGDGAAGETFQSYLAAGRLQRGMDIHSQVTNAGEQSLERAMSEMPRLTMRGRSGRHSQRYVPVGFFGNREKYGVEFNGNLIISKHGAKLFQEELEHTLWKDDTISFRIGTGAVSDFRERENAARQHVLDDYQPVVLTEWSNEGVTYREEAFATLLGAPLDHEKIRGDEPSVLLVKLTASNETAAPAHSVVWFHVGPAEKLRLRGELLEGISDENGAYAAPRLRAALHASAGQFQVTDLPAQADYTGQGARWESTLQPGRSAEFYFRIAFRTFTGDADMQRVATVDYAGAREKVVTYWSRITSGGMSIRVPDEAFNRFYRSVLQHILLSVQRDPKTGLYMDPCGTYDYNMFANETDMQVRLLDMRGLHEFAGLFVEPMIALQGSKPFPGNFRQTDAILHGVRVDADHDYTHSGYNLNHGWTLWTLAEHYLFTRDKAWLEAHLPKMLKAADWIVSERQGTMRNDADGQKVWEYGLLPAGQLEDNEEWQYWFAVNAYGYRGLRAAAEAVAEIDPAQGRRLAEEAAKYRTDIRTAALRSLAAAPVARLRDGTWVPSMPSRTNLHGRDYGWIRNILYGPHVLVDCGIFSPQEPFTSWVLHDMEDNLFMSDESFSTAEQDWFSRGGITLQPNLVNTPVTYLQLDEIPQALRAFYNTFAVSYYPDVNAFTEWAPSYGKSGGPFFKTSDEAGFLTWLRMLLVREDGDKLYLDSGAPKNWFRPGRTIEVRDAATFFGRIGFRIDSHAETGFVDASVDVPAGFRAKELLLRVRHPEGKKISRVEVDGAPWTRFDEREFISLPASGAKKIRVYF